MSKLLGKVLVYTDRHKRDRDFSTIQNYLDVQHEIDEDLMRTVTDYNVTHLISTGDLYDRGFIDPLRVYDCTEVERILSKMVKGNHFMCIGNHFYIERDINPEMCLLQPNPLYKSRYKNRIREAVLKVPNQIVLGPVQISLFHYNKDNKNYFQDSQSKFHIGIYHDETIIPSSARTGTGYKSNPSSSGYMEAIYSNIDLAIAGHVHMAVGTISINLEKKTVPLIIPGALCLTQYHLSQMHNYVNLPLISIYEDSYEIEYIKFNTHLDKYRLYKTQKKELPEELNMGNMDISRLKSSLLPYVAVEDYLKSEGLDQRAVNIFNMARSNEISTDRLVKEIYGKE